MGKQNDYRWDCSVRDRMGEMRMWCRTATWRRGTVPLVEKGDGSEDGLVAYFLILGRGPSDG